MLQNPEFDSKDIGPDDDGHIKCFNLLEGAVENLWIHEVEDVYREIMEDQVGCAEAAAEDGRSVSNIYEVNTWRWQFGRGKPRLGCLTIEET